jgi:hypothetical protein
MPPGESGQSLVVDGDGERRAPSTAITETKPASYGCADQGTDLNQRADRGNGGEERRAAANHTSTGRTPAAADSMKVAGRQSAEPQAIVTEILGPPSQITSALPGTDGSVGE